MPQFIYNASNLIRRVFFLARPYGRKKLAFIFFLSLAQGIFQVIGVTSIFPFLALAADPERIRHSKFGLRFLALLPPMGNRELLIAAGIVAIAALFFSNGINLLAEYTRTRYAKAFKALRRYGDLSASLQVRGLELVDWAALRNAWPTGPTG